MDKSRTKKFIWKILKSNRCFNLAFLFSHIFILFFPPMFFASCSSLREVIKGEEKKDYGVFLGLNKEMSERLQRYKTIVIEPSEFDSIDLAMFHNNEQKVFAYLNVGALENYRSYFCEYEKFSLGIYEDWPDEKWMDVSKKEWQDFIVNSLAFEIKEKGFDGFFVDNTDVYYHYPNEEIYEGLLAILQALRNEYELEIIINGGDTFVNKAFDRNENVFDAVNQECVFTSINFKVNRYGKQSKDTTEYFLTYLEKIKKQEKQVYLLEYGANQNLKNKIDRYCKKQGFTYFISQDKSLTQESP